MRVTVWKNDGESNERLVTRFTKKVQSSRKLLKVRGERYFSKDENKRHTRAAAVKRDYYRSLREKNKFY